MPSCSSCGDSYPSRRKALGYSVCLSCGESQARQVKRCTAPLNKSNYVLITNRAELKMLNPKRVGE
jgi:hypothetical protein